MTTSGALKEKIPGTAEPDAKFLALPSDSPVPGLEVASDTSSGEDPMSQQSSEVTRPKKVSKWRERGILNDLDPDRAQLSLDLSLLKRRDLPVKLVVDDPMPSGQYHGNPFLSESTPKKEKVKAERRDVSPSPVSVCDELVAVGKLEGSEERQGLSDGSYLISHEHDPLVDELGFEVEVRWPSETMWQSQNTPPPLDEHSDGKTSCPRRPSSLDDQDNSQDTRQRSGPIVRMAYDGEMVSVSEQTATKLQEGECAWV